MPPILRSFTIFQDSPPVEESSAPKQTNTLKRRITRSSFTNSENFLFVDNPPITVPDKENLHPVTGERAGSGAVDKKRKDSSHVLATKVHNPPSKPMAAKKHKKELSIVLKDEGSPTKKRKASMPSEPAIACGNGHKVSKAKTGTIANESMTAKPRKLSSAKRTTIRTRANLPRVVEEEPVAGSKIEGMENKVKSKSAVAKLLLPQLSQADIDSRCYELTVKPLADVSQAYEDTPASQDVEQNERKAKFQQVKEGSVEPEIGDLFVPVIASSTNLQLGSLRKTPFEEPTGSTKTFSTPERKAIYAAFTFSSPSPSGERFSKTIRAGDIPRLELA